MVDAIRVKPMIGKNELIFEKEISAFLTLGDLARQLKISVSGLRKIIARDAKFPRYKVGQQLRFSWDAVERYFRKGES